MMIIKLHISLSQPYFCTAGNKRVRKIVTHCGNKRTLFLTPASTSIIYMFKLSAGVRAMYINMPMYDI